MYCVEILQNINHLKCNQEIEIFKRTYLSPSSPKFELGLHHQEIVFQTSVTVFLRSRDRTRQPLKCSSIFQHHLTRAPVALFWHPRSARCESFFTYSVFE